MTAATRSLLLILGLFGLGLVISGAYVLSRGPERAAGAAAIGAPFDLATTQGARFSDAGLKGEPHLVFFGYTHCPDVCPTTLAQISSAFAALGKDAKIGALFVTVDPERDTPEALKDYLSSFDPRIVGLTGTDGEIRAAARAFRAYYRKNPPDASGGYAMDHTGVVYLMDREGRFIGALNLERPAADVAKELSAYL
ncbi:SCO family protein [Methylocella sp.]|uniref:SCO family protein n=1 Tax=Methylocella sp. TaxID=1978226 RepID=UPI0035AF6B39